jgi:hypothetical protein
MDTVTAAAQFRSDPARRVRITLGLRERPAGEPFLAHAPSYACAVQALDELAATYRPVNWESGVLSGAGYAWRRWLDAQQGLWLVELAGELGGDGIEAVAAATTAALAALARREPPVPPHGWDIHTNSTTANGQAATATTPGGNTPDRPGT